MSNRLIHEQSPYLLQHAHNPVNWYPWGDEAFDTAKQLGRPVLVSIGYAACHWCHVMERESFEDPGTAAYMNDHFVCIKVDREEHPDVDHMYMDAVQAISGSGGWPLNVFVTPERAPFYGGTYFPPRPAYNRPSWQQLLQRMDEIWHKQQDEVALQADQLLQHLRQASLQSMQPPAPDAVNLPLCDRIAANLLRNADKERGGFGQAPKFPGTMSIAYLLEHYHYTGSESSLRQALLSIDSMINGGIYDQLGGGLARYATDGDWLVPHFEKMLYDNALLVLNLCDAYTLTAKDRYREVALEIIAFVNRELRSQDGGFYCALDADSEGVEGKYYTWTWEEWSGVAGDEDGVAARYFGVTPAGNWEHTNILHIPGKADLEDEFDMSAEELAAHIAGVKSRLLARRQLRVRPLTDDKCVLAWNALMNLAITKAAVTFSDGVLLQQADAHARWMMTTFLASSGLMHTSKNGITKIAAKLDDYAFLAQALMQLAAATGDNEWVLKAATLLEMSIDGFSADDGFFYYSHAEASDIPVRKIDLYDGALPSANSIMALNLWLCGMSMDRPEWVLRAEAMMAKMAAVAERYPGSFALWATLVQRMAHGMKLVVCTGSAATDAAHSLKIRALPQVYVLTYEKEICVLPVFQKKFFDGNLHIFVCSAQACSAPVGSVDDSLNLITD